MALSDFELGWLVGILEGEGCFTATNKGKSPNIQLRMCDEDIVYRAAAMIERITGEPLNVYVEDKCSPGWASSVRFRLYGWKAKKIMRLLVKHMGTRRRQRIWQLLNGHFILKTDKPELPNILQLMKKEV